MAKKDLILRLAKVLVATAWVDGEVSASEINVLKDLIYSWGDVSEDDWMQLEVYIDSPVYEGERERLMDELLAAVTTSSDKRLVGDTLKRLVESDGEVTDEEARVLEQIRQAMENRSVGLGSFLKSLLGGAVERRTPSDAVSREERIDDFIRNQIYFQFVSERQASGVKIDLPDDEVRKLCLAAGLLAQVAWIDQDIDEDEKEAMRQVLQRRWEVTSEAAELVSRIALDRTVKGLDYYRLTRTFFKSTRREERKDFLYCLFELANSAGKTSFEEIEAIRRLSQSLKLSPRDFIDAKLSVEPEDRSGL